MSSPEKSAPRIDRRSDENPARATARAAEAQYGLSAFPDKPCTIRTSVSDPSTSERMPDKRTFPSKGSGNDVRNGRLGGACGARRRANRAGPMVHKCPDKRFRPRSRAKNDIDHLVVCVFVANDSGVRHCVEYGPVVGTEESRSSGESMAFSNQMSLPVVKDLSGANPATGHTRFPP